MNIVLLLPQASAKETYPPAPGDNALQKKKKKKERLNLALPDVF